MPDRTRKRRPADANRRAWEIVQEATVERVAAVLDAATNEGKNPHAVALGRLGGKKGGKARAEKLTAEERTDIARRAAKARWKKRANDDRETN